MLHLSHVLTVKQDARFAQAPQTVHSVILTRSTFKTHLLLKNARLLALQDSIQATTQQRQTLIVSNVTQLARLAQDPLLLSASAALIQAFTLAPLLQSQDTTTECLQEQLSQRTKTQAHADYASPSTDLLEVTASPVLQIATLVTREFVQAATQI